MGDNSQLFIILCIVAVVVLVCLYKNNGEHYEKTREKQYLRRHRYDRPRRPYGLHGRPYGRPHVPWDDCEDGCEERCHDKCGNENYNCRSNCYYNNITDYDTDCFDACAHEYDNVCRPACLDGSNVKVSNCKDNC